MLDSLYLNLPVLLINYVLLFLAPALIDQAEQKSLWHVVNELLILRGLNFLISFCQPMAYYKIQWCVRALSIIIRDVVDCIPSQIASVVYFRALILVLSVNSVLLEIITGRFSFRLYSRIMLQDNLGPLH